MRLPVPHTTQALGLVYKPTKHLGGGRLVWYHGGSRSSDLKRKDLRLVSIARSFFHDNVQNTRAWMSIMPYMLPMRYEVCFSKAEKLAVLTRRD